jgi:hypothetical protein
MRFASLAPAIICVACFGLVLLASTTAVAQTSDEIRQYDVIVKDKPVGNASIRISQRPDGMTVAHTDTSVLVEYLLFKYHYEFHGIETWQSDQLLQMESRTDDNGRSSSVQAAIDSQGSRIDVRGSASRIGPSLAMTTNYWHLPNPGVTAANFSIIDPDTGIVHAVRLQHVGPDSVIVEGRPIACNHYRLTGDATAELWFDALGRLVRQQTVEQGYPTEQRLARIRSVPNAPNGEQATLTGYQN